MKKSQIILGLFPTNQQATRTIELGMGAFHHPSPRSKADSGDFILFLLPTAANVRLGVTDFSLLPVDGIIVASVDNERFDYCLELLYLESVKL